MRIHLPMPGAWVLSLIWEDPTCLGATKPMCHNYCAQDLQLLKPMYVALVLCNKRSRCNKLAHRH